MLMHTYGIIVEYDFREELKSFIYSQHCLYDNNALKMFKIAFDHLYQSNELVIIDHNNVNDLNFDAIDFGDRLFIKSNAVYKKACDYWIKQGIEFPCSERKLRQYLYDADILIPRNGKKTEEKKTRDNCSYNGYYLYKHIFKNYGGIYDDE